MTSNTPLPSYTTLYTGQTAVVHALLYYSPGGTTTQTSIGTVVILPDSATPGINNNSTSSPIFTTSTPAAAAPTSITQSSANINSTPVLSTPSSTSQSSSSRTSSSIFTSSNPSKQTNTGTPVPNHRLANGTVAGIVIGVALGIALITFLATYLALRRRGGSQGQRNRQRPDGDGGPSNAARHQTMGSEPKQPLVTQTSSGSNSINGFLPQSADDKTVQNEVKTVLDHIELHVENFYQNTQASGSRLADAELAMFDSPYLPSSLASLLPHTNNSIPLIKHALAHFITACITTPSETDWCLLPKVFVLLPNAVRDGGSTRSAKQGFTQSMSRWRALTAYLRPNASEDTRYIAQRDRQINIIVQNFSIAFTPWQNPRYKDEERVRSLVAILKDAADKGIWLFSQPSEFQFQWRKLSPGRIAVAPALVKTTDERGQVLGQPQVMINMTAEKL